MTTFNYKECLETKQGKYTTKKQTQPSLADLQMLNKGRKNSKYWSSYAQWRNLLLITDPLIQVRKLTKSLVKHRFLFA